MPPAKIPMPLSIPPKPPEVFLFVEVWGFDGDCAGFVVEFFCVEFFGAEGFGDDGLEVDGRDGDERKEPPFAAYATDGFTAAVSTVPINTNAVNTAHKKALNFFKVIKGHSSESFFMSSGKA